MEGATKHYAAIDEERCTWTRNLNTHEKVQYVQLNDVRGYTSLIQSHFYRDAHRPNLSHLMHKKY